MVIKMTITMIEVIVQLAIAIVIVESVDKIRKMKARKKEEKISAAEIERATKHAILSESGKEWDESYCFLNDALIDKNFGKKWNLSEGIRFRKRVISLMNEQALMNDRLYDMRKQRNKIKEQLNVTEEENSKTLERLAEFMKVMGENKTTGEERTWKDNIMDRFTRTE